MTNSYNFSQTCVSARLALTDLGQSGGLSSLWGCGQKIGMGSGTGGTSRAGYLEGTLRQHYIFKELTEVSTFLVERSRLPELPKAVKEKMSFNV